MSDFKFNDGLEEYKLFALIHPHYYGFQQKIAEEVRSGVEGIKRADLLEVGVGTGVTLASICTLIKDANILAIDNEEKMLNQAIAAHKDGYIKRNDIEFRLEDAIDFGKKDEYDNHFDLIYSGFTIHNFKKIQRKHFLKNSFENLKYGGKIVIGDKVASDNLQLRHKNYNEIIKTYIEGFLKFGREDLAYKWQIHMAGDEADDVIMIETPLKDMMKNVGFKDVSTTYRNGIDAIIVGYKK